MQSHLDQNVLVVGTRWEEFEEGCRLIWETHAPRNGPLCSVSQANLTWLRLQISPDFRWR
jgi:hypothetical protein